MASWVDEALSGAIELLEKVAVGIEPALAGPSEIERCLRQSARAANLVASIQLGLAPRITGRDPAQRLATWTGQSVGAAAGVVHTAKRLERCPRTRDALARGDVSYAQAGEIARTEAEVAGSESELLGVALSRPFGVLRDTARALRQAAIDPETLEERRRRARHHRAWTDELGMVRYSGAMLPEFGVPFLSRLEAETDRVFRSAAKAGAVEPRAAYAADAFARLVAGAGKGVARRPEIVFVADLDAYVHGHGLRSHIPGVGPVAEETLRRHARDAIVSVVLHQGKEFRTIRRWSRTMPVEIATVLEIGDPPDFAGRRCARCGGRWRLQSDHDDPHTHGGQMCIENINPLCPACHAEKTDEDRRKGLLGDCPPIPRGPPRRE